MAPSLLVLTDLSPTAAKAATWAAVLGVPLQARLKLLHLYHDPLLDLELATSTAPVAYRSQADTRHALQQLAAGLPAPAEPEIAVESMSEAVEEAIRQHQPLLLAMGLSAEYDLIDHLLHNQVLPSLRATHRPLLLVPEKAPAAGLPRRVLLAADAEPVILNAATRQLTPLLSSWHADCTIVNVTSQPQQAAATGRAALTSVRASKLLPGVPLHVREESDEYPATGILHAVDEIQADLLVLFARPRTFLGRLFHYGVTAQVLRRCRVPVLLLPVEASLN